MDLPIPTPTPTPKHFQSPSIFQSNLEPPLEGRRSFLPKTKEYPFPNTFHDPLCNLNLKETSEFVKSLPVSTQRRRDGVNSVTQSRVTVSPSTPGRPVFGFTIGGSLSRKTVPSKWDEAEKWLVCSPSNNHSPTKILKQTQEKVSKVVSTILESPTLPKNNTNPFKPFNGVSDLHLKDKFMDSVEAIKATKEGFVFNNSTNNKMRVAGPTVEVEHRDIGTEMTPLGSSTTSRCPTPFKSTSPARHNTPENRSGQLGLAGAGEDGDNDTTMDISQLKESHLAKLQLPAQYDSVASNWSSREEEEEEISKSLRHFETGNECWKSISDSRAAAAWEEENKTKCCNRYEREEAKIEAWVNLQNAKAEAQSKKLEVKIERMRSNLEEKLMKRLAVVHRKAEELKEAARQQQHSDQTHKPPTEQQTNNSQHCLRPYSIRHNTTSCGCFPYPYPYPYHHHNSH